MPVGLADALPARKQATAAVAAMRKRSEEHTSELQSQSNLVCRLLLEKKKIYHRWKHILGHHFRHETPCDFSDIFLEFLGPDAVGIGFSVRRNPCASIRTSAFDPHFYL